MRTVLADARRGHPGLYAVALAMAALAVVTLVLAVVDQRELLGAPLWFKPLKFSLSITLYSGALAWMLSRLPGRVMRGAGWIIAVGFVLEMVIIVGQAARGVRSHYNTDSTFDALLFASMGAMITVVWLATLSIALRFLHARCDDRVTATAVRLGLVIGLAGMAVGFLLSGNGGHAVGVADGGPGLPLVGWSTTGGDLRIAHFVGMHALQLLPLLAAGLAAFAPDHVDVAARVRVVRVAGAAYAALTVLLTWQALRGQPLLAPDATTLAALAVLVLGTAAGLAGALRRPSVPTTV